MAAYIAAVLASDPSGAIQDPPAFRAPMGPLEDSYYLATGRQLWDASLITARVLVLRSEHDFWSRHADSTMLERHLVHAAAVRSVTLPEATHFVHLDRPEGGRARFMDEVLECLSA